MNEYDDLADAECPIVCPNCWDDGIKSELIYTPDGSMTKLFLQITLFGTCLECGFSVMCVYSFQDDVEESELYNHTEH